MITPGVVKVEPLIASASNSKIKNKKRTRNSHGDIFAEQLGVTLSLTTNKASKGVLMARFRPMSYPCAKTSFAQVWI
jgi:hypothetical protein